MNDSSQPSHVSRRAFLRGAALVTGGAALLPYHPKALADALSNAPANDFMRLSLLLTARPTLPSAQGKRLHDALAVGDQQWADKLEALQAAIKADNFSDLSQFGEFCARHDPAIKATAMTIISGWYLGYTGTAADHSANDSLQFVAFRDALMYQPTLDATVIPTYSRGHTNYWTQPPATIAQD